MQFSGRKKPKADATSIRFGTRISLAIPVQMSIDDRTVAQGIIRNASISGALIETSLELPLHTHLVVTLTTPSEVAPFTHALVACVIRIDPAGVAVEWRDMAGTDVVELLERASVLAPG